MNYHVDFAAFDSTGTLRCFGEIKCRYFKSTKYDAPMVSAYKYLGIKEIVQCLRQELCHALNFT